MPTMKQIRENPSEYLEGLKKRNADLSQFELLLAADAEWRKAKSELDSLKAQKNKFSIEFSEAKKKGESAEGKLAEMRGVSERIKAVEEEAGKLEAKLEEMLLSLPNKPDESVPIGKDETQNRVVRESELKPKKKAGDVLPHYELLEKMGLVDFERGAKVSGHRFVYLRGELARLERAVANFMVETAVSRGYNECWTPYLVSGKALTGTGQLPKFREDLYKCADDDLYLIPTAEVPLTNLYADEILEEKSLPINVCALTPCFRREAGAYQKDIKGLIRQHQFDKVELVKFSAQEESFKELEKMVKDAEYVLAQLGLPYRVLELCTGDLGFASAKTYDLEVWLPSQGKYREISSCSNCTDFQAIRANIRYRKEGRMQHVHTLNGSGVAVGRAVVAIIENYQDEEGFAIPKVLQDFMKCERVEHPVRWI